VVVEPAEGTGGVIEIADGAVASAFAVSDDGEPAPSLTALGCAEASTFATGGVWGTLSGSPIVTGGTL
jgi:hypothetical protein